MARSKNRNPKVVYEPQQVPHHDPARAARGEREIALVQHFRPAAPTMESRLAAHWAREAANGGEVIYPSGEIVSMNSLHCSGPSLPNFSGENDLFSALVAAGAFDGGEIPEDFQLDAVEQADGWQFSLGGQGQAQAQDEEEEYEEEEGDFDGEYSEEGVYDDEGEYEYDDEDGEGVWEGEWEGDFEGDWEEGTDISDSDIGSGFSDGEGYFTYDPAAAATATADIEADSTKIMLVDGRLCFLGCTEVPSAFTHLFTPDCDTYYDNELECVVVVPPAGAMNLDSALAFDDDDLAAQAAWQAMQIAGADSDDVEDLVECVTGDLHALAAAGVDALAAAGETGDLGDLDLDFWVDGPVARNEAMVEAMTRAMGDEEAYGAGAAMINARMAAQMKAPARPAPKLTEADKEKQRLAVQALGQLSDDSEDEDVWAAKAGRAVWAPVPTHSSAPLATVASVATGTLPPAVQARLASARQAVVISASMKRPAPAVTKIAAPAEEDECGLDSSDGLSMPEEEVSVTRSKNETPEERKARKKAIKEEKAARRQTKTAVKTAFAQETQHRTKSMAKNLHRNRSMNQ